MCSTLIIGLRHSACRAPVNCSCLTAFVGWEANLLMYLEEPPRGDGASSSVNFLLPPYMSHPVVTMPLVVFPFFVCTFFLKQLLQPSLLMLFCPTSMLFSSLLELKRPKGWNDVDWEISPLCPLMEWNILIVQNWQNLEIFKQHSFVRGKKGTHAGTHWSFSIAMATNGVRLRILSGNGQPSS